MGGSVVMDQFGMPKPISGAFASVFTIDGIDGRRWAVKCFTRSVPDQAIRYQQISEALRMVSKPWRVEFENLPIGVLSRGRWFPALKMEWIDATGLMSFIENHLWEPDKLSDLAVKFAQMVEDLSLLGIAHGDLQHGNLLVTSSGELKLIDYDGMFVPSLAQMGACEKGHENYQSPSRTMNTWGPDLDNFSTWIIYASLVALTIDPTLWTLLHDQGDEALLFNHADFVDQHNSRALQTLAQNPGADLQALGNAISRLWTSDVQAIPPLDPTSLPTLGKQFGTPGPAPSAAAMTSGNGESNTFPNWVTQTQVGPKGTASRVQGGASWITGHLAPLPLVSFHPSRIPLRLLAGVGLASIVTIGISASARIIPLTMVGSTVSAIIVVFILVTVLLFRRTPEWRAKHEKLVISKERRTDSSKAAREESKFEHARQDVDNREQRAIEKITKEVEKAKSSEQRELTDLNKRLTAQLGSLEKQKQKLVANERTETGRALRANQQQYVANYLNRALISSAKIPGIGQGVVNSLAASGITSAAAFTGLRFQTGPRGGRQVYIVRRHGSLVHPTGVGEKKARDLDNWRRAIGSAALATQPSSLPAAQAQAITSTYTQQRQALVDQERAARAQATKDQGQVKQKWVPMHAAISAEIAPTRQAFAKERVQADAQLTMAQKQVSTAIWQRELAERELAAYRNVSYRRYLAVVIRA